MLETQVEQVLVIPTAAFHEQGHFQGFSPEAERYLAALLKPELMSYRARPEMEQDPSFKQLIPYVVFTHRDAAGELHVFQYRRGSGQGEGRLHRKRSVGVGGHISSLDAEQLSADPYEEGLRRELAEEVDIQSEYQQRRVGLINDDDTEVGRVHLGVVHLFELGEPRVESRETDLVESGFRPVAELLDDLADFETWSQIALRALFAPERG